MSFFDETELDTDVSGEYAAHSTRPKSITELLSFEGLGAEVNDQDQIVTVSRQAIWASPDWVGIFACIDWIHSNTIWKVRYQEDQGATR